MRVLVLLPNWPSFSEVWLHRMIEAMEPFIAAIATYSAPVSAWRDRIPVVSLSPLLSQAASWLHLPAAVFSPAQYKLRRVMRKFSIDAVLCHYLPCALRFRSVWRTTSIPLFVHCHGYDVTWDLRLPQCPSLPRFKADYPDKVRRLAERATLIANSEATSRRLQSIGVPLNRIVVKYLGVPVPDFCPEHPPSADGAQILYLGRLVDFKGPDLTIRAFDAACRQGLRAVLTVAGDGPLRRECEQLRDTSRFRQNIQMIGAVGQREAQRLMAGADIFTAHNRLGPVSRQEEALGVSILEAMASGLPVVTGYSGGVAETVVPGETGLLVEPNDIAAHAAALLQLCRDPEQRRRLGRAGWRRAREHFSIERERYILKQLITVPV